MYVANVMGTELKYSLLTTTYDLHSIENCTHMKAFNLQNIMELVTLFYDSSQKESLDLLQMKFCDI